MQHPSHRVHVTSVPLMSAPGTAELASTLSSHSRRSSRLCILLAAPLHAAATASAAAKCSPARVPDQLPPHADNAGWGM